MKDEHLHEEAKPKERGVEGQKTSADDLKFMRSALEKTYKEVRPDTHLLIMWGLFCIIVYTTTYFLVSANLHKWIQYVVWPLMAIAICYTFITWLLITKRDKKTGFVPRLTKQSGWLLMIIISHFLAWSILGTVFNAYYVGGDPFFLGAMQMSIGLSVAAILWSKKEVLFGGILIFAGMMLTYFIMDYALLILALATGAGFIIPAVIVQRNYRKQEKENAQA